MYFPVSMFPFNQWCSRALETSQRSAMGMAQDHQTWQCY